MPFMLTFDPENMRIMGHALRIIGISCELWVQFLEFEKAIMGKKNQNNLPNPSIKLIRTIISMGIGEAIL